jgi:hypothetical protein
MILGFYDPEPFANDYVSRVFIASMRQYAHDRGVAYKNVERLVPETGVGVVCNADYLTDEILIHFRDNGCPLYAFSCIDSAYLSEAIRNTPFANLCRRIFMVSGVQTTNVSNGLVVAPDMTISEQPRTFLPAHKWSVFDQMRRDGILQSLPYVPWHKFPEIDSVPFAAKNPSVLFRGGNHFFRVLMYFHAVRKKIDDHRSGFQTRPYFDETMNPLFRYCDRCRKIQRDIRSFPFIAGRHEKDDKCTSPAPWGDNQMRDFSVTGLWNNRCPESFYWLARQFEKRYGALDHGHIQAAFNHIDQEPYDHLGVIARTRFYADAKWEFSINMAQRFWEAASVGTVNLLPLHANDQDYFPILKDGEHYVTCADDFSDISAEIDGDKYRQIAHNAHEAYKRWIEPTTYPISTGLLEHIYGLL